MISTPFYILFNVIALLRRYDPASPSESFRKLVRMDLARASGRAGLQSQGRTDWGRVIRHLNDHDGNKLIKTSSLVHCHRNTDGKRMCTWFA
jgi:hypothetical protein